MTTQERVDLDMVLHRVKTSGWPASANHTVLMLIDALRTCERELAVEVAASEGYAKRMDEYKVDRDDWKRSSLDLKTKCIELQERIDNVCERCQEQCSHKQGIHNE